MDAAHFYVDLGLLFLAMVGGATLAQALRQPLIVGYVVAGIVIGPFTPGLTIADPHPFEQFAEVGVILLMFSIGMEFSFGKLLRVGALALVGGPLGIVLVTLLTMGVGRLLGWDATQGMVVGAALSVASTMVLVKFLLERGDLDTPHGRAVVGITIVEDLAVVVMTLLVPALGSARGGEGDVLSLARGLLLSALVLVPVVPLARWAVPRLLLLVARSRSSELLLLATVTIAVGTAAFTVLLGLSHALGAFLAGMVLSDSPPAHAALDRILPIRDVFVAVFFVSVGMLIRPATIVAELPTVAALVAVVTVGKLAIWTGIVRAGGYPMRAALLAGLGLGQIGEFSYILGKTGLEHGLVARPVYDAILATSLVTILVNAAAFRRHGTALAGRLARSDAASGAGR
ncbi:MAG TPA: cation:proton antiporter [Candidatus Binatia bacterium]|nr:cation:proton antiporter [Candidatus Binatia bacterium]